MVKNSGGNKTKRDARKHIAPQNDNKQLRVIIETGETYAVVKKLLGGGMCLVTSLDGKSRNCVIRNKFKGRGRSSNMVSVGIWILVGIREWEVRKSGKETNCDLLHVYSSGDKEKLLQKNDVNFDALLGTMKEIEDIKGKNSNDISAFEFASTAEISYQELLANRKDDDDSKQIVFEDTEFDIDDI
jgi:translation initiation factor IF-1